jgi:chromosome segregation ATPase
VSDEYAALIARRDELDRQRFHLEAEQSRLHTECSRIKPATADQEARILALVDGRDVDEARPDSPQQRFTAVTQELNDLRKAQDVVRQRLVQARLNASKTICDQFAPEHQRRVRKIVDALLVLNDACADYAELADEFNDRDVAWSYLQPMQLTRYGQPNSSVCMAGIYLRDAAQRGFIDASEIPSKLRE